VQVALTVIEPAGAPVVLSVAALPLPEMLPLLADHPPTVTGTLSGLVQVHVILEFSPAWSVAGFAEHDMVGGFFGGSFTVKFAVQVASPFFFILGSEIWAVAV
jgi:hypothetical protein